MDIKQSKFVLKEEAIGKICDQCGKTELNSKIYENNWLGFSESHQGWGSDSSDSFNWYDVCSAECFIAMLPVRIENNDGYSGAEIAGMPVNFCKQLLALTRQQKEQ
jgi:hypothetical protein